MQMSWFRSTQTGIVAVGAAAVLLLSAAASAWAQAQAPASAPAALLENEHVTVREWKLSTGARVDLKEARRVIYARQGGTVRLIDSGGAFRDAEIKSGQAAEWGTEFRAVESIDLAGLDLVVVELKDVPPSAAPAPASQPAEEDEARQSPDRVRVLHDSRAVRVMEITLKAGAGPSKMHSHPGSVVVALTDAKARFVLPDGAAAEREVRAGQVVWSAATRHTAENIGKRDARVLHVELKHLPPPRP